MESYDIVKGFGIWFYISVEYLAGLTPVDHYDAPDQSTEEVDGEKYEYETEVIHWMVLQQYIIASTDVFISWIRCSLRIVTEIHVRC